MKLPEPNATTTLIKNYTVIVYNQTIYTIKKAGIALPKELTTNMHILCFINSIAVVRYLIVIIRLI